MNFERLRELVLERAIRGELVPQNCDEDCVKEGTSEDVPFDVPASWGWVQLADLSVKRKTVDPMTIDEPNVELWSIPAYDSGAAQEICPKDIGSSKKIVLEGDVLLSKIVPHIKRAWVVTESGRNLPKLASTEWLVYGSGRLIPEFLALQFRSPYFRKKMLENISGMGSLKRANPSSLAKVFLPVPPLLEQVRIVAKLEEAFAEIDRAEKAYEELQTLAGVLRGQILQEAIQGKLVPQLVSDGVTKQIAEAPEEVPFDIPNTWSWIRGEELAVKRKTIDPSTLTNDEIELWSIPAYDAGVAEKVSPGDIGSSKKVVQAGDVLLAKIVPHIERVWIVSESANSLMKLASTEWLVYASELFLPEFMGLLFRSPYFRTKMMESVSGMGSLKRANPRTLAKVWLPVPPIKEQERIVIKVETLLKQVNLLLTK